MRRRDMARTMLAVVAIGGGALATTPARAPHVAVIDLIQPGEWQLKLAGPPGTVRSMCLTDPDTLIQIEHGPAQCSRFVIKDMPRSATVHYTCPGAGHGRTMIAVESTGHFHLATQGIAHNAPFDDEYEGARIGACAAGTTTLR